MMGRQSVKHRLVFAPLAVGMLLTVAACGGQTEGKPLPETGSPSAGPTSSSAPTSTSSSSGPLASIEACELLTDSDETKLNVGQGKPEELGSARACNYLTQEPPGESTPMIVGIREEQGLKDFVESNGPPVKMTVAGHSAKLQCNYGNCLMAIAVTEGSRVDVTATNATDEAKAKAFTKKAAKMVAQNLPKG